MSKLVKYAKMDIIYSIFLTANKSKQIIALIIYIIKIMVSCLKITNYFFYTIQQEMDVMNVLIIIFQLNY